MPNSRQPSSPRQRAGAPAVADQPQKPRASELVPPRRIGRKMVTMAEEPTPSRASRNTMDSFSERPKTASRRTPGDQEPPAAGRTSAEETGPGYLRLRFRVEGGEMTVRGASFVEGPLDRPQFVTAGLSYEARVGRRRVAVGDVPEFTERRSFPDPAGRAGMERHHISEVPFQDFTVRIPADQISEADLADLNVDLFRWRGRGPGDHIEITELTREPKAAVARIARFSGLTTADVPAPARRRLRAAPRKRQA
jgi:hypothetical protein